MVKRPRGMAQRAAQTRFSKGVRWEEAMRASCGFMSSAGVMGLEETWGGLYGGLVVGSGLRFLVVVAVVMVGVSEDG